jgi:hypothetical protein
MPRASTVSTPGHHDVSIGTLKQKQKHTTNCSTRGHPGGTAGKYGANVGVGIYRASASAAGMLRKAGECTVDIRSAAFQRTSACGGGRMADRCGSLESSTVASFGR